MVHTLSRLFQRGGHTYILQDGYYDYEGSTIKDPPSGTPDNPTIIKADNDGLSIIDGKGVRSGININKPRTQYITIEGFRIQNPGEQPAVIVHSPDNTDLVDQTNNIIILRTGARGGAKDTNNSVWGIARIRDSLFEDIWGWGAGRYVMSVYSSTKVTVRRAVFRWDQWDGLLYKPSDPKFNMSLYNTHDSLVENVILLDSNPGAHGGFYIPSNDNGKTAIYTSSSNNTILGMISLNINGTGISDEGGSGEDNTNNRFENIVSWGNKHGFTIPKNSHNTSLTHGTLGGGFRGTYFGGAINGVTNVTLKNCLVYNNSDRGINGPLNSDYNNIYLNSPNYSSATPGPHDISTQPGLKYLLRTETGSTNKGADSDGGDIGATIIKRYQNGILSNKILWPYPYEARIKNDLCETETRGFCNAATLTHYIWEYLGNPLPTEYDNGDSSDTIPPNPPNGLTLTIIP